MVVDDNPNNLKLLEGMLRDCGYQVRLFPRGELALAAAFANPPDLFLLDIMMPGMDGFSFCQKLKADRKLADIPVIFLSALNDTADKVKAFQYGGIDYITKPFQIEEVRARIETHLRLRQQKRLLQENYEKLQQLESLRDNLVHMVVHDMRAHLSIIHGVHEVLEHFDRKNLSEEGARKLRVAINRTDYLVEMINSLLAISKLESGKMDLNLTEFDIVPLVGRVTIESAEEPGKHNIIPLVPQTPVIITADESLILRVIQNLVGNAIKYSPEGKQIRIQVEPLEETVRVSVQDQGPGVPPDHQERIFDKFFQRDNRKDTFGLGLTFCKLAVEAHGGQIGVKSDGRQGSEFWFTLPKNT